MEEISNFKYIWEEWIVPLVRVLYNQTDKRFREYCGFNIRKLDEICNNAESYYQCKREEVKIAFYGKNYKKDSETEHCMDFHKLSSIICRVLIEFKVYDFNERLCKEYIDDNIDAHNTDWMVKNALINYRLAFYSSVVFLFHSMQFEYYNKNMKLFELLEKKSKLDLYEFNNSKDMESFENCIVLDLAKRDIGNHSFDYFMYAIIMYQLEEHNKSLLIIEKFYNH